MSEYLANNNMHLSEIIGCKISSDFSGFCIYDDTGKFSVWDSENSNVADYFWISGDFILNEKLFDLNYDKKLFAYIFSDKIIVYDFASKVSSSFDVPDKAFVFEVIFVGGDLFLLCDKFVLMVDFASDEVKKFNHPLNDAIANIYSQGSGVVGAISYSGKAVFLDFDDGSWNDLFNFGCVAPLPFSARISPDGKIISFICESKLIFIDAKSKKILREIFFDFVRNFQWDCNSKTIICNGFVYDVVSGEVVFGGLPVISGFIGNGNIFFVDGCRVCFFDFFSRAEIVSVEIFSGGFDPRILNFSGKKYISHDGLDVKICNDKNEFNIGVKNSNKIFSDKRADVFVEKDANLIFNCSIDCFNNVKEIEDIFCDLTGNFSVYGVSISFGGDLLILDYDFSINKKIVIISHPAGLTAYSFDGAVVWDCCLARPAWAVVVSGDENMVCAIQGDGVACWRFVDDGSVAFSAISFGREVIAWRENGINYKSIDNDFIFGRVVFDCFGLGQISFEGCKEISVGREEFISATLAQPKEISFDLRGNGFSIKPNLYILSVGVGSYCDPGVSNLNFAAKDAKDFSLAMSLGGRKIYGNIYSKVIVDDQANFENVVDGVDWICRSVTQHDVGVVFLSGHGFNDPRKKYMILPFDVKIDKVRKTAVPMSFFRKCLGSLAGKTLFFIDTCHSGGVLGDGFKSAVVDISEVLRELSEVEGGVVVFSSSTGRQYSYESQKWCNGAFTKAIVEGLAGAADYGGSGKITHKMLDLYVSRRVRDLTNGEQSPVTQAPGGVPDFPIAILSAR